MPVRRSRDELLLRLALEPRVYDVVVEGTDDESLTTWFLRSFAGQLPDTRVYSIEEIDVPSSLFPLSVDPGARDRVVRLSEVVAAEYEIAPIVFIADRDLHVLLPNEPANRFLRLTDGADLEALFFNEAVLDRFQTLFLQRRVAEPRAILSALTPALEELFLIRAADRVLDTGLGLISPNRCCRVADGPLIVFDRREYLTRLLTSRAGTQHRDRLEEQMATLRELRAVGQGPFVQGKDFVRLLSFLLGEIGVERSLVRPDLLRRALMACVDPGELASRPLFKELLRVLTGQAPS